MPAAKDELKQYVTVAPVRPKGPWLVCSRRVGTKDRLAVFAQVASEGIADSVVKSLNRMQGELEKLEVPAQRVLEEVRAALTEERKRVSALQRDVRNANEQIRERGYKIGELDRELGAARKECERLRAEFAAYRDANPVKETV